MSWEFIDVVHKLYDVSFIWHPYGLWLVLATVLLMKFQPLLPPLVIAKRRKAVETTNSFRVRAAILFSISLAQHSVWVVHVGVVTYYFSPDFGLIHQQDNLMLCVDLFGHE